MKHYGLALLLLLSAPTAVALNITRTVGWNESLGVEWQKEANAAAYQVKCTDSTGATVVADSEAIRYYPECVRADIAGLKAGEYTVTVTALDGQGNEITSGHSTSVTVTPFIREGFAFRDGYVPGAYNTDGTPKEGAQIIYVTAKNANTVTLDVVSDAKGKKVSAEGLTAILKARGKGYDKTPLIIRIIGCVSQTDVTGLKGKKSEYLDFTGANTDKRKIENITIEGVGNDATLKGFGIFTKRSRGIEIRNLGIMLFGDDGVSMEADNANNWVHHCDFFYGSPGSDKDQVKGDGSIDMKYNTSDITIDHNHFFDCGKTTFAGGATEDNPIFFTYHHNWFDHADSRCPRLCHATVHIYNNYFDANPTMCLLSTENTSAFVEANYYRNCPSPMEINMQGTNKRRWPDGKQNGGMNKAFNNLYEGQYELITQHDNPTDFDAYVVADASEKIPETVKSLKGGNTYNNFDTEPGMYSYQVQEPEDVPETVRLTAGRMEGGDIKWTFDDPADDTSTAINAALKELLTNYRGRGSDDPATTGISAIPADPAATTPLFYDLSGRKISRENLTTGIYIKVTNNHATKIIIR